MLFAAKSLKRWPWRTFVKKRIERWWTLSLLFGNATDFFRHYFKGIYDLWLLGKESAVSILEDMLETMRREIMEKEPSLSLAIYEYTNMGNEDFFIQVNENSRKRWVALLNYWMDNGEFNIVDSDQIADLILYYYQGLRMWSHVIPFETRQADRYVNVVKQILLDKERLHWIRGASLWEKSHGYCSPFAAAKRDWKSAMIQSWKTFRCISQNANMNVDCSKTTESIHHPRARRKDEEPITLR